MRQQDARFRAFRLHEHLGKRGGRSIGGVRGQGQFGVTGELQVPVSQRAIGDAQAPHFHVVFGRDADFQNGLDTGVVAMEVRPVGGEVRG